MQYDRRQHLVYPGSESAEVVGWVRAGGQLTLRTSQGWGIRDHHYRWWLLTRPQPSSLALWGQMARRHTPTLRWSYAIMYRSPPSTFQPDGWRWVCYRHPILIPLDLLADALDADHIYVWEAADLGERVLSLMEILTEMHLPVHRTSESSWALDDVPLATLFGYLPPTTELHC